MRLSKMKNGEYLHSKVTNILYTRKGGILYKFPFYADLSKKTKVARIWTKAKYSLDGNHFVEADKSLIDVAKEKRIA